MALGGLPMGSWSGATPLFHDSNPIYGVKSYSSRGAYSWSRPHHQSIGHRNLDQVRTGLTTPSTNSAMTHVLVSRAKMEKNERSLETANVDHMFGPTSWLQKSTKTSIQGMIKSFRKPPTLLISPFLHDKRKKKNFKKNYTTLYFSISGTKPLKCSVMDAPTLLLWSGRTGS